MMKSVYVVAEWQILSFSPCLHHTRKQAGMSRVPVKRALRPSTKSRSKKKTARLCNFWQKTKRKIKGGRRIYRVKSKEKGLKTNVA